ncbi:MAG: family 20 glycosylhydrolase, partial [Clostridium sp.]
MKKSGESTWKFMALMLLMVLALTPMIAVITVMTNEGGIVQTAFMSDRTANNIIPKPLSYEAGKGKFILNNDSSIYVKGNNDEETEELVKVAELLREKLNPATGYELKIVKGENTSKGNILLTTVGGEETQGNEVHKMVISPSGVTISAFKPEGVSRGIQTLRQSLPADIEKGSLVKGVEWSAPASTIVDKPEYSYRGLMIDVARHFFTVDEVKRQIDLAAQYKINKVHLHLSDDQGWRLEIKKYPDLTLIGGSTEVGGGLGGYYSQEEFKDIVDYASKQYVEIVPEFDMPGHTNAALASYGFLNPDGQKKPLYIGTKVGFSTLMTDSEETYNFIDDVIKEVSEISPSKYIQIGGDEADSTPKKDYDYFVGRVAKIAQKYGKQPIGWDPIDTSSEITSDVILQNWRDTNKAAVDKKMKIITSNAAKAY